MIKLRSYLTIPLYACYFLLLILPAILFLFLVLLLSSPLLYSLKVYVEDRVHQVITIDVDLDCDALLNFRYVITTYQVSIVAYLSS